MMDAQTRAELDPTRRTVYVEPSQGGANPETVVRVVWGGDLRREEKKIFESLVEALAYAQSLCDKEE